VTDRLSLANALAEAKIDRVAAERIATEIFEAIHDSVATKADLQAVETAVKSDLRAVEAAMKSDLRAVEAAMKGDLRAVEAAVKSDLHAVEAALRGEMAALHAEMALLEHRLLIRLGSLAIVVAGLLFAALRYLPPAH
jgi:hypothetical protein